MSTDQVKSAKELFSSFKTFFSNEPYYQETDKEAMLAIGEYEIWWKKDDPTKFFVTMGYVVTGSEPEDFEVIDLDDFATLHRAVAFVAMTHINEAFSDFIEKESERQS